MNPDVTVIPQMLERISWAAILAGAVIALITQVGPNLLGLSVGASSIHPTNRFNPVDEDLPAKGMIWMVISTLISLAIGGWVAGRLSGVIDNVDGLLHGLITWALVTLISLFFLTTTVGSIISGVAHLISRGLALAGRSIGDISSNARHSLELQNLSMQNIQNQIRGMLEQAGINTQQVQEQANQAVQGVPDAAKRVINDPALAQQELTTLVDRLLNMGQKTASAADRETVVGALMQRANISKEQAQEMLHGWEQQYHEARTRADQAAREATETVAKSISTIAAGVFAALVIGAFAAGLGGALGSPDTIPAASIDTQQTSPDTVPPTNP